MVGLPNSGRRRRLLAVGSLAVLLLAILPQVLYAGHWTIRGLENVSHLDARGHEHQHASHCHSGAAGCSDQPLSPTPWWLEDGQPLILAGGLQTVTEISYVSPLPEVFISPPEKPPRKA